MARSYKTNLLETVPDANVQVSAYLKIWISDYLPETEKFKHLE